MTLSDDGRRGVGRADGDRSGVGNDALRELGQHVAGSRFDEGRRASLRKRLHARLPPDRRNDVTAEERAQLAGVVDQRAGDVLGDREPRRPERDRCQPVDDGRDGGLHQRGVERAGHVQSDGADLPFLRERLRSLDRWDRSRDHDLHRRVLVRDDQHVVTARIVAQRRSLFGVDAEQRGHGSGAFLSRALHRPAPDDDHVQRVGQTDDIGGHEGCELAERVSRRASERDPFGIEDGERRHGAAEQRRLDELGRGERRLVMATRRDVASHRLGSRIQDAFAGRVLRPGIGHPEGLRALAGEDDGRVLVGVVHPHRLPRPRDSC